MLMSLPPNFGQAFDLSSLGKPAPASPPSPNIAVGKVVTKENLASDFVELSMAKPVVLLCWTTRAPHSLDTLAILDKLNKEDGGSWELGSIDVDAAPEVAGALQARTVPYAVALVGGQPIPLFEEAMAESDIKSVISKLLTIAAEQGIGEVPEEKLEPEETEALAALEAGDLKRAEDAYKRFLARMPANPYARLGLAHTQLQLRIVNLDPEKVLTKANTDPLDIESALSAADMEVATGSVEPAFIRLLALIKATSGNDRARVKDRLLELFSLVDPADPRVIKARTELANALF
jgi:putative thioredoxin